jgi:hypothetical protein
MKWAALQVPEILESLAQFFLPDFGLLVPGLASMRGAWPLR